MGGDSTTSAIDRLYDLVDGAVDTADRILNRTERTEELHAARRTRKVIDADTSPTVKVKPARGTTAIVRRAVFRIIESADAETGAASFVVTNGDVREEFSSREQAEKVLRMLRAAGS